MTTTSPPSDLLMEEKFHTIIHRSPGLGQDLDWLKTLHAGKILLVTRDRQHQRRLKLKVWQDSRFVILTEDEVSAAQIQELQEQIESLETEKAAAEERAEQAEAQASQLEAEVTRLKNDHESALTTLKTEHDTKASNLKQQMEKQAAEIAAFQQERDGFEKALQKSEAQVELLRDCLVSEEAQEEEPPNE